MVLSTVSMFDCTKPLRIFTVFVLINCASYSCTQCKEWGLAQKVVCVHSGSTFTIAGFYDLLWISLQELTQTACPNLSQELLRSTESWYRLYPRTNRTWHRRSSPKASQLHVWRHTFAPHPSSPKSRVFTRMLENHGPSSLQQCLPSCKQFLICGLHSAEW